MPTVHRIAVILALLMLASSSSSSVFVDASAPGRVQNGKSWATAYRSIGQAIKSLRSGGEIWVRGGVYPERIVLKNYVHLYGGFAGNETNRDQRAFGNPPTVIDAQGKGRAIDVPARAWITLDGLSIVNGSADRGGGVRVNTNSTIRIRNCRIEYCKATQFGGGIYFGVYTFGEMSGCLIARNSSKCGGGAVVEYHSYPTLRFNVIAWNRASASGGGVYCPFHSGALMENCTIAANRAAVNGGGVYAYYGGPVTLNYCIVAFNLAPAGGGVFGGGPSSQTAVYRSCLWSNANGDYGGAMRVPPPTAGVIYTDPLFHDIQQDDYALRPLTPCGGMGAFPEPLQ